MIPGETVDLCRVVEGIVFSKNRTHKKMKSEFENPKILLLNCSVEFERKVPRLSSFDTLLAQEEEYLHILVLRIASIKPDIVLVTKSVSRLAQEFMLQEGLCLALNIKPHTMQIISRITNSDILSSTEHIVSANMGTCGRLHIETYQNVYTRKTCMYIEKCPKHLFNTVVIRGADSSVLAKVKKILQFVCYVIYNLKLEQSVLAESFVPTSTNPANVSQVKRQLLFDDSEEEKTESLSLRLSKDTTNGQNNTDVNDSVNTNTPSTASNDKEENKGESLPLKESKILSSSPSVDFSTIQHDNRQKESGVPAVPPIHPILWFHPREPNLYTCSYCLQINNSINNIMLANNFNSSLSSYDTVYTLAPTSATVAPFDDASRSNTATDTVASSSQTDFSRSYYNDYFDGENNNDMLSERDDNKSEFNDPNIPRCAKEDNDRTQIKLNVTLREYRAALRRNPFGIEFNYRSVIAATEQEQHVPSLSERKIETTQHILYLHTLFCHATASQCITHEMHYIDYYSRNDLTLGQFLENYCFNLQLQCKAKNCNRSMLDHERSFFHHKGRLNVSIKEWGRTPQESRDSTVSNSNLSTNLSSDDNNNNNKTTEMPKEKPPANYTKSSNTLTDTNSQKQIFQWSQCKVCNTTTPQMTPLTEDIWKYSFGKYLELVFYGTVPTCPGCNNPIFRSHIRYFYFNNIVVIFEYEPITVMGVCVPPTKMTLDLEPHRQQRLKEIEDTTKVIQQTCEEILQRHSELSELCTKVLDPNEQTEVMMQIDDLKRNFMEEFAVFCAQLVAAKERTDTFDLFDVNLLKKRFFANTLAWNSTVTEIQMKLQKRPTKPPPKPKESLQTELTDVSLTSEKKMSLKEKETLKQNTDDAMNEQKSPETIARTKVSTNEMIENVVVSQEPSKEDTKNEMTSLVTNEDKSNNAEKCSPNTLPQNEEKTVAQTAIITNNPAIERTAPSDSSRPSLSAPSPSNVLKVIGTDISTVMATTESSQQQTLPSASVSASANEIGTMEVARDDGNQPKIRSNENSSLLANSSIGSDSNESKGNHSTDKDKDLIKITQTTNQTKATTDYFEIRREAASTTLGHGKRIFDTISHIFSNDKKFFSLLEDTTIHYFFPPGVNDTVIPIYEKELSSVIAYTLNSVDYKTQFESFDTSEATNAMAATTQPQTRVGPKSREEIQKILTCAKKTTIVNTFKQEYQVGQATKVKVVVECTTYYAQQFDALRRLAGIDELQYITSLARSKPWAAKGGKSRSHFAKTLDDRFVLKGIPPVELESFLQFAPQYFDYLSKVYFHQVPTALTKIFGVYSVHYKRKRAKPVKQDIIVMENLFYKRTITKILDLKGSLRERKAAIKPTVSDTPAVLLDENVLECIL
jgi:hypothetical protein